MRKSLFILPVLILLTILPVVAQNKEDALVLYRDGKYDKAIEVCQKELASYPEDAVSRRMDSYSVMCWSYVKQGKYKEAIQFAEEAQRLSRYDYRIMEILAESYFYAGESLKSLEYFQKYTVLNPVGERVKTAYYYMGEIFIQLGEYNHADIALSTALYHAPNVAKWWIRLGYSREMAEEWESSLVAYEKALSLNPSLDEAKKGVERMKAKL